MFDNEKLICNLSTWPAMNYRGKIIVPLRTITFYKKCEKSTSNGSLVESLCFTNS